MSKYNFFKNKQNLNKSRQDEKNFYSHASPNTSFALFKKITALFKDFLKKS